MRGPDGELATVAHDLRSALSASVAYLDLAREKLAEQPLEPGDLDAVARGLERMESLVERVEALSRAAGARP